MKRIRFYFWLILAFLTKNLKILLITSLITFLLIIFFIYTSPIFFDLFSKKKEVIGLLKKYPLNNPPEEITQLISNPLLTVDKDGKIIPVLAQSWEIIDEGKKYRFHLKNNLFWSNNKNFSAKDLTYRFQDIRLNPVDDLTIEFILESPLPILPYFLTKPVIKEPLIGAAGLYTVSSYKLDGDLLTEVFLQPRKSDLPIKIYKFYDTEEKMVTAYKKGSIDFFRTYNNNIKKMFLNWKNTQIDALVDFQQILTLFFNLDNSFLKEKNIRKAIAYIIPEFKDYGQKATSPIPPTNWAFNKNLKTYFYIEEKATNLFHSSIKEATKAPTLELATYYDFLDVAQSIKNSLEKLGLKINLKIVSFQPDNFDLFLTLWQPPSDPDQYYFWHSTQKRTNITKFINLKVDKLLEEGRATIDLKKRREIYYEFQEIMIEELPAYFIYHPYLYSIKRR